MFIMLFRMIGLISNMTSYSKLELRDQDVATTEAVGPKTPKRRGHTIVSQNYANDARASYLSPVASTGVHTGITHPT
jgi:hypothetical protein